MKSRYVYELPEGELYVVGVNKWNKEFGSRGRYPFIKCEIYLRENSATAQFVISWWGIALVILLSPILLVSSIILDGYRDTVDSFKRSLFQKKYGSFSSEMIYKENTESWDKLMRILGK